MASIGLPGSGSYINPLRIHPRGGSNWDVFGRIVGAGMLIGVMYYWHNQQVKAGMVAPWNSKEEQTNLPREDAREPRASHQWWL